MPKHRDMPQQLLLVCTGSSCKDGAEPMIACWKSQIKKHHLKGQVAVVKMHCTGNCKRAPVFCVQPANRWYLEATEKDAKKAFKRYILHPDRELSPNDRPAILTPEPQ